MKPEQRSIIKFSSQDLKIEQNESKKSNPYKDSLIDTKSVEEPKIPKKRLVTRNKTSHTNRSAKRLSNNLTT